MVYDDYNFKTALSLVVGNFLAPKNPPNTGFYRSLGNTSKRDRLPYVLAVVSRRRLSKSKMSYYLKMKFFALIQHINIGVSRPAISRQVCSGVTDVAATGQGGAF
ncbi:hypothetical protein ElyMa_003734300 [Elysia marginata]|uniref:Uncharacterized protein n=1 Tax=Elysia marginata TaxID=1093978 RepID=A0AAV4F563_9GAST|nr:hypothetical protein ElyMa_003734300 [Elysia marginata]